MTERDDDTPPVTPYRGGRLYVCREMCATCVFRPGNLMDLVPGRLRAVVQENLDADAALVCHRTIYEDDAAGHAICRGFYDRHRDRVPGLALAEPLGVLAWLDPPPKP